MFYDTKKVKKLKNIYTFFIDVLVLLRFILRIYIKYLYKVL